jgi:hypothetical protein
MKYLFFALIAIFVLPLTAFSQEDEQEFDSVKRELDSIKQELLEIKSMIGTQQIRSRILIVPKYIFAASHKGGEYVLQGWELEIGGVKKDKKIISGLMSFAINFGAFATDDYFNYEGVGFDFGWGVGCFVAPRILSVREVFKFVPGFNAGYWMYYGNGAYEMLFGGPELRTMVGHKYVYFDLFYKLMLGGHTGYYTEYYPYEKYHESGFSVKRVWGAGISLLIGKGNW